MGLGFRGFLLKFSFFFFFVFFFFWFFDLECVKIFFLVGGLAVLLLLGPKKEEQTDVPILNLLVVLGVFCLISSKN